MMIIGTTMTHNYIDECKMYIHILYKYVSHTYNLFIKYVYSPLDMTIKLGSTLYGHLVWSLVAKSM